MPIRVRRFHACRCRIDAPATLSALFTRHGPIAPELRYLTAKLAALPVITVPTVTLDGEANGIIPASDGRSSAAKFSGRRIHHRVPNAGHALPQEAPKVFAAAVVEVTKPV